MYVPELILDPVTGELTPAHPIAAPRPQKVPQGIHMTFEEAKAFLQTCIPLFKTGQMLHVWASNGHGRELFSLGNRRFILVDH